MKTRRLSLNIVVALALVVEAAAAEIMGTVSSVTEEYATVKSNSGSMPRPRDKGKQPTQAPILLSGSGSARQSINPRNRVRSIYANKPAVTELTSRGTRAGTHSESDGARLWHTVALIEITYHLEGDTLVGDWRTPNASGGIDTGQTVFRRK